MPDQPKSSRKPLRLRRRDPDRPGALERGRMRRRLHRQRQVREALLFDLGALVFELQRQGRREPELLQAKAAELTAVDEEVRALSDTLDVDGSMLELAAGGIAGSCSQCAAIMPLEARYCATCGAPAQVALASGTPQPGAALGAAQSEREAPPAPAEEPEQPSGLATEERTAPGGRRARAGRARGRGGPTGVRAARGGPVGRRSCAGMGAGRAAARRGRAA